MVDLKYNTVNLAFTSSLQGQRFKKQQPKLETLKTMVPMLILWAFFLNFIYYCVCMCYLCLGKYI